MSAQSVCLKVRPDEAPVVKSLIHRLRTMRSEYGNIRIDIQNGKAFKIVTEESILIVDAAALAATELAI